MDKKFFKIIDDYLIKQKNDYIGKLVVRLLNVLSRRCIINSAVDASFKIEMAYLAFTRSITLKEKRALSELNAYFSQFDLNQLRMLFAQYITFFVTNQVFLKESEFEWVEENYDELVEKIISDLNRNRTFRPDTIIGKLYFHLFEDKMMVLTNENNEISFAGMGD